MGFIITFDHQLFLWIQYHCHNLFFDAVFPWIRHKQHWYPLYFLIGVFLLIKYRWTGLRMLLVAALCLLLSDNLSSKIIKPLVHRDRPCNDAVISTQFTPLIECGDGYSFTSSHAANHFAIAFVLCLFFYKKNKWLLIAGMLWAGTISFAQVYVGVHYPLDIMAGACLGIIVALSLQLILNKYFARYFIIP